MSPQEAAHDAYAIAVREHLPLARMAELEAGVNGALDWFAQNIVRFFLPDVETGIHAVSPAQYRRYIAWMRLTR